MIRYIDQHYGDEVFSSNRPLRSFGQIPERSLQEYLDDLSRRAENNKPKLKKINVTGTKTPKRITNTGERMESGLVCFTCFAPLLLPRAKRKHL